MWIFGYLDIWIFAEYSSQRWSIPKGAYNLLMEDEPSHTLVLNDSSATGKGLSVSPARVLGEGLGGGGTARRSCCPGPRSSWN
jgi:hypothetical protein